MYIYRRFFLSLVLLLLIFPFAHSATISIPSLELVTRGAMSDGAIVLSTNGSMDFLISGGDKFGGEVALGFSNSALEQAFAANGVDGLALKGANVAVRNLFSTPLTISYFIGEKDRFCSGEDFASIFGASPLVPQYSGLMYFDSTIYEGIHSANGTGLQLSLLPIKNTLYTSLYFYQDDNLLPGQYSYDLRTLLNFPNIKLEAFMGGSLVSTMGYYRMGVLLNAITEAGSFLMQLGVPRWDPANDTLGIELFFMLFEVDLNLGLLHVIPSVFMRPGYYEQAATGEGGIFDVNLNLRFGELHKHLVSGGFETNLSFENASISGLQIKISPYLELLSPGVVWDMKCNIKVFPMGGVENMFEGILGIKAVF